MNDREASRKELLNSLRELRTLMSELTEDLDSPERAESKPVAELKKFRSLHHLAVAMTAGRSLEENLLLVVGESRKLLDADTSYIALRDVQTDEVYMHTLSGIRTEAFMQMRIPYGAGLGGRVAETGKGYIVDDYFKDTEPLLHDIVRDEGLISGMAAPVQMDNVNLGVLYVFNRKRTAFSWADLQTLSLLGNLAAVEISRKNVEEELRKAHEKLEQRVKERTADLRAVNETLVHEISERRKAVEALFKSERMLNNILSSSPLGIAYFESGRLAWANQAMATIFGYHDERDYIGRKPRKFYASNEEYERVRTVFLKTLGENRPATEAQAQFITKEGAVFDGQVNISALDPSQPNKGTITIIADISARKRAEEALRESEEKHRAILENMEEVYYEVDIAGNFTFVNDPAYETFGFRKGQLIGRNLGEFFSEESTKRLFNAFRMVLRTGKSVGALELNIEVIDGPDRSIEMSIALAKSAKGEAEGFRGIFRDVTNRKQREEELIKLEKLDSIGLLAGGIAHDFNNILTSIQGNISRANLSSGGDHSVSAALEKADRACARARDLTQQLLTFSKGGAPVKRAASIADIVVDSCEFALRGSNVSLDIHIPPEIWTVEVDEVQISQVVGNLVMNANNAMPTGGRLRVDARNVTLSRMHGLPLAPSDYVRLSFTDEGMGIPDYVLPKIFDPYFTTRTDGSGLGLTTAYSIIKNHGGLITVESELGRGTTFHVHIPASRRKAAQSPSSEREIYKGKGKILIMDDEDEIRELVQALLKMLGYHSASASDGSRAIETYLRARDDGEPFDLVILDLTVPGGLGGTETLRELKTIDPHVKALVSSGYSDDPIMAEYASHGFVGIIPKPYNVQQLSEAVKNALHGTSL